ncbi:MAG: hypothetical protein KKD39_06820 [Candidatus Altiarchaeota archaeon]|nr:hypothetical protein [Candidatus Altiarchaeota archaeon]
MTYNGDKNSGQIGVENFVLIGFIMLTVIVGTITLWNMGVFEPYFGKRGYVGFSQIVVVDWIVGSDKAVVSLRNEGDTSAIIFPRKFNLSIQGLECAPPDNDSFEVKDASDFIVEVECPGLSRRYEIGDYFDADLTINYTHKNTGRSSLSVGKLYGHIEDIESNWTAPTIGSTTTTLVDPQCFYKNCSDPGEIDEINCGEIWFRGSYEICDYCSIKPGTNGLYYCNPHGRCGEICLNDNQCHDPADPYNLCDECIDNLCTETNETDCGPCELPISGLDDPKCKDLPTCEYCAHYFVVTDPFIPSGHHEWTCEPKEDCGKNCLYVGFDRYLECHRFAPILENHCPHCNEEGKCEQGDCGKPCGPANPLQECEEGCEWCNYTVGEPSSFKCELGDCGRPCDPLNPQETCEKGCRTCYQVAADTYQCVKTDIAATINAHNGTGFDTVALGEDITVNATGYCSTGVDKLIVSNAINVTKRFDLDLDYRERCGVLEGYINTWFSTNNNPDPLDTTTETQLQNQFNLTWWETKDCSGSNNCKGDWIDTQDYYGTYCYFAMAKKEGSQLWSQIVSDYIQVGYIRVYIISPLPENP